MVKCRDCENARILAKRSVDEFERTRCGSGSYVDDETGWVSDVKSFPLNPDEERECPYYQKISLRTRVQAYHAGEITGITVGLIVVVLGLWLCSMGIKIENAQVIIKNWMGSTGIAMACIGGWLAIFGVLVWIHD